MSHILVVDDDTMNRKLLTGLLSLEGYETSEAHNGETALRSAKETQPDLILLDINMPKINGMEVGRELKLDARTSRIPIIFISALDSTEQKVEALQLGAVDYIVRPFDNHELLTRIKNHLAINTQLQSMIHTESLMKYLGASQQEVLDTLSGLKVASYLISKTMSEEQREHYINQIMLHSEHIVNIFSSLYDVKSEYV